MNRLNTHFKQISSYDLITKSNYTNSFQIPSLKTVTINISSIQLANEKKQIIPFLLVLELITGQKGKLTLSKKNKITLKIKKGMVVGCKITLNKIDSYDFLENLITFILPTFKEFPGFVLHPNSPQTLSFSLNNILSFPELAQEFLFFSTLPPLHITLQLNSKNLIESKMFLTSLNFPIKTGI